MSDQASVRGFRWAILLKVQINQEWSKQMRAHGQICNDSKYEVCRNDQIRGGYLILCPPQCVENENSTIFHKLQSLPYIAQHFAIYFNLSDSQ